MSMAVWALGADGDYMYAVAKKASAWLPPFFLLSRFYAGVILAESLWIFKNELLLLKLQYKCRRRTSFETSLSVLSCEIKPKACFIAAQPSFSTFCSHGG